MKKILPAVLILVALLYIAFRSSDDSSATSSNDDSSSQRNSGAPTSAHDIAKSDKRRNRDLPIATRVQNLLDNPDNTTAFSDELMAMLRKDEAAVLAHLNSVVYTEGESDQVFNEIQFISKTLDHYLIDRTFDEVLTTLEQIKGCPYLHDGSLQQIISNTLSRHEGRDTPNYEQVYTWVKNNPEVQAAQDAGTAVGGMLYLTDSENAWKKAVDLPVGRIRSEALTTILTQTYSEGIEKAVEPLSQIEITPDLDPAISNLVSYGLDQGEHHDTLIDWATRITDKTLRLQSIEETMRSWIKEDPQTLQTWVNSTTFDDPKVAAQIKILYKQTQTTLTAE